MTAVRTVRPSESYSLAIPTNSREDHDERVSSFWVDAEPLLLQLSSYRRATGDPVPAVARLRDRMRSDGANWRVWCERLHPDDSIDQATAEYVDKDSVRWIHTYLVWPHLTIYVLVSGPSSYFEAETNWAIEALKSIRLVVH